VSVQAFHLNNRSRGKVLHTVSIVTFRAAGRR
jgi:hypothetical protein